MLSRRDLLKFSGAVALGAQGPARKRIAAVITEYRRNSHADVIVGRLLEGYDYNGERRNPRVQVVSMYTDQAPSGDMSRDMAARHGVRIFPTVPEAVTLGTGRLAVDGVVLIGEHGEYPDNEKGQRLYPRYELSKQIIDVFRKSGRAVPVFCDKHLSVDWWKAKWMYDQSRELKFAFMAGSSVPLAWRRPPLELDLGTPVEKAVVCFEGGKESYGIHGLEALECMVERRAGGETGIAAVECLEGAQVWQWTERTPWAGRLLDHALRRDENATPGRPAGNVKQPVLFVLEYRSGLQAAAYILNGHSRNFTFAAEVRANPEPVSTELWLQPGRPHSHFSALAYYIEQMIITGRPAYRVERTLLTTGALAALMDSSYQGNRRLETPHLKISYRAPKESLYSQGPVPPLEDPRS